MAEENETEIICPLCMFGYILPDSPMVSISFLKLALSLSFCFCLLLDSLSHWTLSLEKSHSKVRVFTAMQMRG